MLYLHQNYPTHPFFDIDSSLENRERAVKSAQDFLVILGAEGRMVLAAGVLCGNPEPSHLAYLLQSKYGESKSNMDSSSCLPPQMSSILYSTDASRTNAG